MATPPMPVTFSRVIGGTCPRANCAACVDVSSSAGTPGLGLGTVSGTSAALKVGDATSTPGMGDEKSGVAVQDAVRARPASVEAAERDARQTMGPRRTYRWNHHRPLTWVERAPIRFPLRSRGDGGDCSAG